jgi:hypothetical protein
LRDDFLHRGDAIDREVFVTATVCAEVANLAGSVSPDHHRQKRSETWSGEINGRYRRVRQPIVDRPTTPTTSPFGGSPGLSSPELMADRVLVRNQARAPSSSINATRGASLLSAAKVPAQRDARRLKIPGVTVAAEAGARPELFRFRFASRMNASCRYFPKPAAKWSRPHSRRPGAGALE